MQDLGGRSARRIIRDSERTDDAWSQRETMQSSLPSLGFRLEKVSPLLARTCFRSIQLGMSEGNSKPVLRDPTPRHTDGEKESEEFLGEGEKAKEIGLSAVLGVAQHSVDPSALDSTLRKLRYWTENPNAPVSKADLANLLAELLSGFRLIQSGRTLDERM